MTHKKPIKLPRKKKSVCTINDVLTTDDINGILADLEKTKPEIQDLIVIYLDKKTQKYVWQITDNTLSSTAVWMLESTKLDILNADAGE